MKISAGRHLFDIQFQFYYTVIEEGLHSTLSAKRCWIHDGQQTVIINGLWIKIHASLLRLPHAVGRTWIASPPYAKHLGSRPEYHALKFLHNSNLLSGRVQNDLNYFSEYEIFGSLFLPVSIDLHHESDVEPLKDHLLSAGYGDRFLSDFRSEAVFVFKVCL